MSKVAIQGDESGTGTFTIAAPNSNSNYTMTMPEEAGVITTSNSPYLTFRNRIINGDMRIDQRNAGASQSINNTTAYTVDRWYVNFTGGTGTSQRVAGTGSFANALRLTGGASVSSGFFGQKIESFNSADLAGQTVTVTIRASSSVLTSLSWFSRFPTTQDNYASVTAISNGTLTINSTPTNYTFQFTCPAGVSNGLEVYFTFGSFASGTLDITGVQLEAGSVATPFERRPYGTELSLCQRYYIKYWNNSAPYAYVMPSIGFAETTTVINFAFDYSKMRAFPTVLASAGAVFQCEVGGDVTFSNIGLAGNGSARIQFSGSGFTPGAATSLRTAGATTAILQFSAEL